MSRRSWLQHGLGAAGSAACVGMGLGVVDITRPRNAWAEPAADAGSDAIETEGAPASPARILMVGDSMIAGALGLFLERGLEGQGYTVHRRGKSSTGLARPDFFNWMKEGKLEVEKFQGADAAIVMFGGNDVQGLRMPDRSWIRWHEPEWPHEYARRVNAFADIVAGAGCKLFWIGMPVMRPPKFHGRVQRVNWIFRAEMAIRPNSHFVDIWRVLADAKGEYADRIKIDGKRSRVRAGDGIHLSVRGAHHTEAYVRAIIHRTMSKSLPTAAAAAAAAAPANADG